MQIKLGTIGETVSGMEDINQELGLILSTPLSSVPHMPDFGSNIYEYLDKAQTSYGRSLIIAEAYRAINKNSERFVASDVALKSIEAGKFVFAIKGEIVDANIDEPFEMYVSSSYLTPSAQPSSQILTDERTEEILTDERTGEVLKDERL